MNKEKLRDIPRFRFGHQVLIKTPDLRQFFRAVSFLFYEAKIAKLVFSNSRDNSNTALLALNLASTAACSRDSNSPKSIQTSNFLHIVQVSIYLLHCSYRCTSKNADVRPEENPVKLEQISTMISMIFQKRVQKRENFIHYLYFFHLNYTVQFKCRANQKRSHYLSFLSFVETPLTKRQRCLQLKYLRVAQ